MAIFKGAKAPGIASGLVLGGFCLLGLVLLGVAAAIILSLISIYLPNNSQAGYGDAFRINSMGLKSTYTNISNGFTKQNTIVSNRDLSSACTTTLAATGIGSVAGCTVTPHNVVQSGSTTSTVTRRKRDTLAALFSIATANVYFTTTCGRSSDKNKTINSTSLSSCVRIRLIACNQLFNSSAGSSSTKVTPWTVSNSFVYSILGDDYLNYVFVTVSAVAGVLPSAMIALFGPSSNNPILTQTITNQLNSGCQYIGPISQGDIAAALAAQNTASYTTTSYSG